MKNIWKWIFGIALILIALLTMPFLMGLFFSDNGYGMMPYNYGWHMPMMYGGFGMMPFMWLISLASLVLIGLGIAWLINSLNAQKS